jgi:pimeloyl-ACP methyl ester carboxylesterase
MKDARAFRVAAVTFAVIWLVAAAPARALPDFSRTPMIFVHGFSGSGAQFESQKMRFTSNRYPESWVRVIDYDSTFATETREQVLQRVEDLVAEIQADTGHSKVDLLGHSLGTSLMQDYLSTPARAANIAHYVNIDGSQADAPPGGVPTLALWAGRGAAGRQIVGATNVTIPNQTHVECATSAESFVEMYRFFTGRRGSGRIRPGRSAINVAGRALNFPVNAALIGATIQIFELSPTSGQPISPVPVATFTIDGSGDFGPVTLKRGVPYDFVRTKPGATPLHYVYEPFVRDDYLVRLLDSDALNALAAGEKGPRHVGMVIIRYKEFWGDQGIESDAIAIDGTNVCNAATCPIDHLVNAIFAGDRFADGETDLSAPHPAFFALPFITGVDIFIPANTPPVGTVTVSIRSRRGNRPGRPIDPRARTVRFPNYASLNEAVVVQLRDFERPRR